MRKDRSKLTTSNYESLTMIKSDMMAKQKNATKMTIIPKMKAAVTSAHASYQHSLAPPNPDRHISSPINKEFNNIINETSVKQMANESEKSCSIKRK